MKQESGHITRTVFIGYLILIVIAAGAVAYVYNLIVPMAGEEEPDMLPRQKVYLITGTLSLLYESEIVGQAQAMNAENYLRYNKMLNQAQRNIDSLRTLVADSVQQARIDTINYLLNRKRRNTKLLLQTIRDASSEKLYRENIEKVIAIQDSLPEQVEIKERIVEKQDTVVVRNKPKGFFRRLADVFVPSKEDTNVVVNTSRHILTDTVIKPFNTSDTIVSVLKSIQDSVADQRKQYEELLSTRTNNLRYNNNVITQQINQILRDIEQEEMNTSLARVQDRQQLLHKATRLIVLMAVAALLFAVLFLFLIWRDVARSMYYRQQLEKAKQYAEDLLHSREQLMLTISHDIRAPLSSIIGYIELLQHLEIGDRQRYYLENMSGSAGHILSLVNDLLDFHRLQSNKMEIHRVPFNIPALFSEIYDSFRPIAEGKGLQFVLNLKDENSVLQYLGDPIRIRQIANNLLSNAIKFTTRGRVVLVVAVLQKNEETCVLSFTVVDAGPGIPKEEQEKIFGEFTRLNETGKVEGFGLGLSITKKLTERMGGTLSVESTVGKGSAFCVEIPLEISAVPSVIPSPDTEETIVPLQRQVYCLLVDDDPFQLAMTEEMLIRNGVTVTCCSTPHEVFNMLLYQGGYDLLITDIQMPGLDGFLLIKQIRESSLQHADTFPVIALSASLENEAAYYEAAGFTAFLNKPFTASRLLNLIRKLVVADSKPIAALDFGLLMNYAGDQASLNRILRTFSTETRKNIALMENAIPIGDRKTVANLAHKLIPLFAMLGIAELENQLRMLDKGHEALSKEAWDKLVRDVVHRIMDTLESVEQKIVE